VSEPRARSDARLRLLLPEAELRTDAAALERRSRSGAREEPEPRRDTVRVLIRCGLAVRVLLETELRETDEATLLPDPRRSASRLFVSVSSVETGVSTGLRNAGSAARILATSECKMVWANSSA
jgi:hypothetical protein